MLQPEISLIDIVTTALVYLQTHNLTG